MTESNEHPWFIFRVEDAPEDGVEVPKLERLLHDLSSAFYAIARIKIGAAGRRPGRRTIAEEALAGVRLIRIVPGSTTIEMAPPRQPQQDQLPLFEEPTSDEIAYEFFREVESITSGRTLAEGNPDVRRHVRTVIEDAGQIGTRAEVVFRPQTSGRGYQASQVFRQSFAAVQITELQPVERTKRMRLLSGHTYMVDVEPGRQRVRLKLPDGRDLTIDVAESLMPKIAATLDRVVEVEVEEEAEGATTVGRTARAIEVLPSSGPGSDRPPKSIEELEREQNLPSQKPDYQALASVIWLTEEDVERFETHLREMRRAQTA